MENFIRYFSVFLLLHPSLSVRCLRDRSFSLTSSNFTVGLLKHILVKHETTVAAHCEGVLIFNSASNELTLKFLEDEWHKGMTRLANIYRQTLLALDFSTTPPTVITKISFLCLLRDFCDQFLFLEYFDEISTTNYDNLILAFSPTMFMVDNGRGNVEIIETNDFIHHFVIDNR